MEGRTYMATESRLGFTSDIYCVEKRRSTVFLQNKSVQPLASTFTLLSIKNVFTLA